MSYQALYRVFRPQSFKDMAGQEHITRTLQNALAKDKFSHAYLFSGPRGTGKTSVAKIVAKAVNCEKAPTSEPCNECVICKGITDGSLSDVIEIDAASNNGVDEIREIRENVKYAPSVARYKVYIVDEVHMLSQGAFNALLKTLEEPPAHVIFILATTEPHKIPPTIISRCQRFDFKRIPLESIKARLSHIIQDKGIEAEGHAVELVAKAGEGGMRDALSILDQAVAYGDGKVTVEDVLEVTGMVSHQLLSRVIQAAVNKEVAVAIQAVNEVISAGKDPERFLEDLIFYYRDLLLYKASPELESIRDRLITDEAFASIAENVGSEWIHHSIRLLSEIQQDMRRSGHSRIFLEIAMVKLCETPNGANQSDDAKWIKQIQVLEERIKKLEQAPQTAIVQEAVPQKKIQRKSNGKSISIGMPQIKSIMDHAVKQDLQELRQAWPNIMERVRQANVAAHAWLLESKPVASSTNGFLQAFKYDFHCQMVTENKNNVLQMVEEIVFELTGKHKKMQPIPFKQWEEIRSAYIKKMEAEGETSAAHHEETDPLVLEAEKLVGPDLLEIRD
ncbi:MAG: DNA polymerase III subunit gamma/tau [Tuberibacillus sp.]